MFNNPDLLLKDTPTMADLFNMIPTDDTIVVNVKHPLTEEPLTKDDGKEMTITVYAPHSSAYKAIVHEQTNKRIQKAAKGKKITFTAEELENTTLEMLAKTTKDWSIQLNGKSPKFSVAEAFDLYNKLPWLKQQVLEAQEDYSAFLKG
jgi:hypothetical protein